MRKKLMAVQNYSFDLQGKIRAQLVAQATDSGLQRNNAAELRSDLGIPQINGVHQLQECYIDRRLGLISFCLDKVKSLCGVGKNSKEAQEKLDAYFGGQISSAEAKEYLKEYKYSQRDGTELFIDTLVGLSSFWAFKTAKKASVIGDTLFKNGKNSAMNPRNIATFIGAGAAMALGLVLKPILKGINAIGISGEEREEERTIGRDMLTGAIDGALAPLGFAKNLAVGLLGIFGINSLSRYIFLKKDEETDEKSIVDFAKKQIDGIIPKALCAAAIAYSVVKGRGNITQWEGAAKKALENAKSLEKLKPIDKPSEFEELVEQIGFMKDGKITEIISNSNLTTQEKMIKLEEYNIFLPKYLQTIPDNAKIGELGEIVTKFKSDCPTSRTLDKAKDAISKTFGEKYAVQELRGTGTVAETYLAKEKETGKEVVIKILKEGISPEKIEKDRAQILELIEKSNVGDADRLEYYKKRVHALFDAWQKEVDLKLESEAAELLGKNARNYAVIKPIEVKDNIYVMEKAPGVQFNHFVEHLNKNEKEITVEQAGFLFLNYSRAFFEQLVSVPKKGMKVMHADPHPGNVFIDIDNYSKMLTFIDTGNVLRYTPKEAITNTFNHIDYMLGNSEAVAKSLLKGAVLPENMTQKQAVELLTKELNEKVYNTKTIVPKFNLINDFCANVMHENKIISNPNNTNLLKAEATYVSNLASLEGLDKRINMSDIDVHKLSKKAQKQAKNERYIWFKEIGHAIWNSWINNVSHTFGEFKARVNYISDNKEKVLTGLLGMSKGTGSKGMPQ